MKGPASLRVEQKGQPWRSHRSTDEAGENQWRKGWQLLMGQSTSDVEV